MVYTDYKFYIEEFFGTMPEDSFNRLNIKASAILKQCTFNRIIEPLSIEVKQCTCTLIELIYEDEKREGKNSESIDGYSVTYELIPLTKRINDVVRTYLLHTGLLNVGCYN